MIEQILNQLISGKSLSTEESYQTMNEIMSGNVTPAQFGAMMVALRLKGETAEEIAGFARSMKEHAVTVTTSEPTLDIVGTGGDHSNTFNISTASAFIAAGAGLKVAKHGNRAMSSRCGSADVLDKLGVRIDLTASQVEQCIDKVGIGFIFAQSFHPAMKYAAAPRREIGIRTVFNLLGPLTNPAGAPYRLIGVADKGLLEKIVRVLQLIGCRHSLVVHGEDGTDEISITGKTYICELLGDDFSNYSITPEQYGFNRADLKSIQGGTPEENAEILRAVLAGETGPRRDVLLLNAAAGLLTGGRVTTMERGIEMASKVIDSGAAAEKVEELVQFSRLLAEKEA